MTNFVFISIKIKKFSLYNWKRFVKNFWNLTHFHEPPPRPALISNHDLSASAPCLLAYATRYWIWGRITIISISKCTKTHNELTNFIFNIPILVMGLKLSLLILCEQYLTRNCLLCRHLSALIRFNVSTIGAAHGPSFSWIFLHLRRQSTKSVKCFESTYNHSNQH